MQSSWHCSWRKKWSAPSRTHIIFHTLHLLHATLSHTYNYIRTYIHIYIPTVLPSRSFTTSFVFPSLSPLKLLKFIIGRSWLVGLFGPLILFFSYRKNILILYNEFIIGPFRTRAVALPGGSVYGACHPKGSRIVPATRKAVCWPRSCDELCCDNMMSEV